MIGIGGMVITKDRRILTVQETFRQRPHWKLPGGYVDPGIEDSEPERVPNSSTLYILPTLTGESLPIAVRREIFEETGVETEFVSLIAVRHVQPSDVFRGAFNCSDFYFVALMKPVGSTDINMCTREIQDAKWMDVSSIPRFS